MRRLAVIACLTLACAKPSPRPDASVALGGRWVAENFPMAYHFWGDSAEIVMYPPQAPAPPTWRVRADTVLVTEGSAVSPHRFNIRGDSLFIDWNPGPRANKMIRIAGTSGPSVLGTWRTRTQRDVMIVTFRSDGVLVGELGVAPFPRRVGDTLMTALGSGTLRQVVRPSSGELQVTTLNQPQAIQLRLVRRPWGCFGVATIDQRARECRD